MFGATRSIGKLHGVARLVQTAKSLKDFLSCYN
jgi:hypothetical protein